jgi:hypothetical protein
MADDKEAARKAAQAERDAIKTVNINEALAQGANDADLYEETKEEVEEKELVEEKETQEKQEENKEQIEETKKTEEDLEAEKLEAKSAAEKARIQKRIDKEVAKRKALEDENAELKRKLEAKEAEGEVTYTKADVESEAKKIAAETLAQREFVDTCNKLAEDASKLDKNFDEKIKVLGSDVGPIPSGMIGILGDMDNGGAVLKFLTDDLDEYERIRGMSAGKMALELSKIGRKIEKETEDAKKPKIKEISKVPDPAEKLGGKGGQTNTVLNPKDMQDFVAKRNAQVEARRQARLQGMR